MAVRTFCSRKWSPMPTLLCNSAEMYGENGKRFLSYSNFSRERKAWSVMAGLISVSNSSLTSYSNHTTSFQFSSKSSFFK